MSDAREHILNVSLRLFLRKPFKEVTMKEIVEQTGLSKGAFYHYFSSKEQVFEEVIKHSFADFINMDFGRFSRDSLFTFYNDFLNDIDTKMKAAVARLGKDDGVFSANHYFILFDAIKILPAYKAELFEHQKGEMNAWKSIIKTARKNGEIASDMTDEQLAELFIYTSDGVGIALIMEERSDKMPKKLSAVWGGIYNMIKT